VNCAVIVCIFSMQDDKLEQTVKTAAENVPVLSDVCQESENKEIGLESVPEDMDIVEEYLEGDDFADCVLEDVLLIDSEDGLDDNNESDNDLSKPGGIIILLFVFICTCFGVSLNVDVRCMLFVLCFLCLVEGCMHRSGVCQSVPSFCPNVTEGRLLL